MICWVPFPGIELELNRGLQAQGRPRKLKPKRCKAARLPFQNDEARPGQPSANKAHMTRERDREKERTKESKQARNNQRRKEGKKEREKERPTEIT